MIYERLRTVPTADELLDQAFRRALRPAKAGKGRGVVSIQRSMVQTVADVLSVRLLKTVHDFPNFDELSPFYYELTETIVGIERLKMSLASVQWAGNKVRSIARDYQKKMKYGDPVHIRKQAYARIASIVNEVDENLRFLNDARGKLRKLPEISGVPTIIVAGYPNVGKSSFVRRVTDAKPEIATYPFTTKGIYIGHFYRDKMRYQVVDTPGLLDRPLDSRNAIELQAISALKHVGDLVLLLIDPAEHCGYPLTAQLSLLHGIEQTLAIPVLAVANKCDLADFHGEWEYKISTETGYGVNDVVQRAIEIMGVSGREREEDLTGARNTDVVVSA
ncbi:MAG: GTPase [Euryarchaeota archaeon]|nr:MAG: GTPase Obg [ANME-2 cluster archaeon]MEA1865048.1 GTPase [Euryarchaeota archaeon]